MWCKCVGRQFSCLWRLWKVPVFSLNNLLLMDHISPKPMDCPQFTNKDHFKIFHPVSLLTCIVFVLMPPQDHFTLFIVNTSSILLPLLYHKNSLKIDPQNSEPTFWYSVTAISPQHPPVTRKHIPFYKNNLVAFLHNSRYLLISARHLPHCLDPLKFFNPYVLKSAPQPQPALNSAIPSFLHMNRPLFLCLLHPPVVSTSQNPINPFSPAHIVCYYQ